MKIVFTGGGTGGHVIPNLVIIEKIRQLAGHAQLFYIGSKNGIERKLAEKAGVKFYGIQTGKLRRYLDWQNIVDAVKIPIGITQAIHRLLKIKPDVIFSKGGFVSVPVAIAAGILRIPLIIHESDLTPGLATRITAKFAKKICLSFPTTHPGNKTQITGNPVRPVGDATVGRKFLKFENKKPIVLIAGGSSGAVFLNLLLEKSIFEIEKKANIVWLTGKGKIPPHFPTVKNLRIFEYLEAEYLDVLAAADLVVSRGGANAIFEIAAAGKPSLLIPLSSEISRGDQVENARFFERAGAAMVLSQEKTRPYDFSKLLIWLITQPERLAKIATAAEKLSSKDSADKIAKIILDVAAK
ncbi:undecaprenyldiphospho-muramoylpentapeptide beta-N-acetylglucosaminyltransferase [Candidatus Gracilibacteria bacterium]|nr:undecaprenyldiphospho-muramoylpentapeptide beta-N-acetylglucosaminyltransferase [Candidatus Gracilibacteria bacterium]MCF7896799.1 undecaprenyldiphospho-muramoylpentapeptide beta-N-acetylglucosaminyltransferase [Candidatus Gracilibacteria bacterium]